MSSSSTTDGRAASWTRRAVVAAAVAVVFARSAAGGFVADDRLAVVENSGLGGRAGWWSFLVRPASVDPYHYVRPARYVEFALDRAFFGDTAAAFHVHSLLWHLAGSLLLLAVLDRLVRDRTAALVGALFWAVHPVLVEPVAWISGRSDVACAACSFAALLFALRTRGVDRDLAFSLAATALALAYKESALALPLVVAALRWTKLSTARVWPYCAVVAAFVVYRVAVRAPTDERTFFPLGIDSVGVIATTARAFGFYVVDALLPAKTFDWHLTPSRSFADAAAVAWLAVHAAIVVAAVVARRRAPVLTVAVAWWSAFLVPVANWPVFLGFFTADRYLCLPLAGAAVALAWAVSRAPRRIGPPAFIAIATLGATSFVRVADWSDDETLNRAALDDHESPGALDFFARRGRDESVQGILASPDRPLDDATRRSLEASLDAYRRMLRALCAATGSDRPIGLMALRGEVNASNVCWFLGKDDDALVHADEALRIDASVAQAHYDRALPLLRMGFAPQAMAAMRSARRCGLSSPGDDVGGFFLRAAATCERDGMPTQAADGYADAVDESPDGAGREVARRALARLRATPPSPQALAVERTTVESLDAALAARVGARRD